MELRQLAHFVAVAEELHFGRAARRLHMTQPPLSASIKRLEATFGVALFERDSKRVALTAAGDALLVRAREIVSQAGRTQALADAIASGRAGRIEVGFTGIVLFRGVAAILTRFRRENPQVTLALNEHSSQRQLDMVRACTLDAGYINSPVSPTGCASVAIFHDPLVACLPQGHALARESSIDLALLRDEPFVMFERAASPAYFDQLIALCVGSGFHPRIEVEVMQTMSIVGLVSAGMGVSVVPRSVANLGFAPVAFVPIMGSPVRPSAFMIWPGEHSAPGLSALIDAAAVRDTAVTPGPQAHAPRFEVSPRHRL